MDEEKVVEKLGKSIENYDPTLDLSEYQYPSLDLLNKYDEGDIQVTKEELEENKDKIIETLKTVSKEDVQKLAEKYLKPSRISVSAVVPEGMTSAEDAIRNGLEHL